MALLIPRVGDLLLICSGLVLYVLIVYSIQILSIRRQHLSMRKAVSLLDKDHYDIYFDDWNHIRETLKLSLKLYSHETDHISQGRRCFLAKLNTQIMLEGSTHIDLGTWSISQNMLNYWDYKLDTEVNEIRFFDKRMIKLLARRSTNRYGLLTMSLLMLMLTFLIRFNQYIVDVLV